MFNVTGGELVIILLIALVVLGPERLPGAARSVGKIVGQIRDVSNGFQKELKAALDEVGEPIQGLTKPTLTAIDGGAMPDATDKPQSAEMSVVSPGVELVEPEPVAGWATPPRPAVPEGPSAMPAPSADAAAAAPPVVPPPADAASDGS